MAPLLVAPLALDDTLPAALVAAAIGRGLERAGLEPPDLCPLEPTAHASAGELLTAVGFDARMLAARAVVLADARLDRSSLRSVLGEAATRARQTGVPAHAIVAKHELDRFDQRILDLQTVLEAPTLEALEHAGEQLAARL